MTAITIAFDSKGNTTIVHGAEVSPKEQQKYLQDAKVSFPNLKDIVRLEMWTGADGRQKIAIKPSKPVKPSK